jgi:hypothetical protein
VDHALEVIALHKKAKTGQAPGVSGETKVKAGTSIQEKLTSLSDILASEKSNALRLVKELERVVDLYRQTGPGGDFESRILNVAKKKMATSDNGASGSGQGPTEKAEVEGFSSWQKGRSSASASSPATKDDTKKSGKSSCSDKEPKIIKMPKPKLTPKHNPH